MWSHLAELKAKSIDNFLSPAMQEIPCSPVAQTCMSHTQIVEANLKAGINAQLPYPEDIIDHLMISHTSLSETLSLNSDSYHLVHQSLSGLSIADFPQKKLPMWFFILFEAKRFGQKGNYLGPMGSLVVAETMSYCIRAAKNNWFTHKASDFPLLPNEVNAKTQLTFNDINTWLETEREEAMNIDWGSKKGLAMGFNSSAAEELNEYHPRGDGYHFVDMIENTDSDESVFTMKTSNTEPDADFVIEDDDYGWSEESGKIIELLELKRDPQNPDALIGGPTERVFQFGYSLVNWRVEMHEATMPTGEVIEIAIDTLTWQRQNEEGQPSDKNGVALQAGESPIEIETSWVWRIINA